MASSTPTEAALYRANGLISTSSASHSAIDRMALEFEHFVPREGPSIRPFMRNALAQMPSLGAYVSENGLDTIAARVLGRPVHPVCGDATRYAGQTYWHYDVEEWTLPMVKLAIYLDPDKGSVDFNYIPGSHLLSISDRLQIIERTRGAPSVAQPVALSHPISRGALIWFDPRLLHAVEHEDERRQISIIFTAVPANAEERADLGRLLLMNSAILA